MRATMAAVKPMRPGMPMSAAGAKPIANAIAPSPSEVTVHARGAGDARPAGDARAGDARAETARARLEACPAIMIKPSARFAGNAKGRLGADRAINPLYFTRTAKT